MSNDKRANRFKSLRDRFGLSQQAAGEKFGTSLSSWQSYERKGSVPREPILLALAESGVDLNWLVCGDGNMLREDNSSTDPRFDNPELFTAAFYDTVDHLKIHGRTNKPSSEFVRLLFIENLRASAQSLAELEAEAAAEKTESKETSDVHN